MSFQPELAYKKLVFSIILLAFPIALVVFAFSSCEIRHRPAKAACRAGAVEECLEVARIYDEASSGIVGFLLSNVETARVHYDRACRIGSAAACNRLGRIILHGADSAGNSRFTLKDAARAYDQACKGHLPGACYALGVLYVEGTGVNADESRGAQAFAEGCAGDDGEACNQLALFHQHGRGGLVPDPKLALELFSKSCKSKNGPSSACAAELTLKKTGHLP